MCTRGQITPGLIEGQNNCHLYSGNPEKQGLGHFGEISVSPIKISLKITDK